MRSSWAVTYWGVPTVVINEKYEKRSLSFVNVMGKTGLCVFGIVFRSFTPGYLSRDLSNSAVF